MNWSVVGIVITLIVTVAGWGVTFGVCKNQIEDNKDDIKELKEQQKTDVKMLLEKQNNTDQILQEITRQLVELNTKMSLLLKGKILTE